jgi:hypothetical protein
MHVHSFYNTVCIEISGEKNLDKRLEKKNLIVKSNDFKKSYKIILLKSI